MGSEDSHGLGYGRVDADPNVAVLVATMDATAGWEATRRLRSWERDQLALAGGQRLLDVGCGLGDAALVLAEDLGDDGEIVGVDVSTEMLRIARSRAGSARCRVRFAVGARARSTSPRTRTTRCDPNARCSGSPTPLPQWPRWCEWCVRVAVCR